MTVREDPVEFVDRALCAAHDDLDDIGSDGLLARANALAEGLISFQHELDAELVTRGAELAQLRDQVGTGTPSREEALLERDLLNELGWTLARRRRSDEARVHISEYLATAFAAGLINARPGAGPNPSQEDV